MGATVLVVDDDPSLLVLLEMILTEEGYRVVTAGSAQQAWDLMKACSPEVVLLDWMMPGCDGGTLCQRLKQTDLGSRARVIMMSCDEGLVRQAVKFRADGYVLKPFEVEDLLDCVETALRRKSRRGIAHATFAFAS